MDKTSYIAVFDSGVGGVSVLRELMKLMPNENFYYFGDSANAPYGLKTTNQVWSLTVSAARKLLDGLDAKAMLPRAVTNLVAYVSGTAFYADGQGADHIRLSFCYPPPERIREGVRRLAGVVRSELELTELFGTAGGRDTGGGLIDIPAPDQT